MNNGKNTNAARAFAMGVAAALVIVGMAGTGAAVSGLVAEWHFDGNAQDSSGNGNHGTIYGATFTEGIIGNALSFDGVSNYFTAPITASFNSVKTQGTIVAWINYKDNYLIYEPSCTYGSRALMLWRFGTYNIKSQASIDCAGRILSDWRIGSQTGSGISQSLKSGQWYHIALVYDSNAVILYINGQKVKSSSLTGELGDADDKFWIGRNGNAAQPMYFHGLIDEVKIYNYALSASEVQASYNGVTPVITPTTITPTPVTTTPAPTTPAPTTPTPTTPVPTISTPSKTSASVSLHGEKTDVVLGEDILLKLSAVGLITKPKMHVQVIIIPPSGMSVTSSEFSKSGAGQFTSNYELEPGDGRDIEVRIKSNQIGDFNVNGRIVYYFGDEKDKGEDYTLNLPVKVRKESAESEQNAQKPIPGFGVLIGLIGLLLTLLLKRRRRQVAFPLP